MKICGLMPLRADPEKTMVDEAFADMKRVCDETIILHDQGFCQGLDATEQLHIGKGDGVWSDFSNRLVLLARAHKYGCRFAMWQDDDERLGPTLTKERVRELCESADGAGLTAVAVRVRTAWDDTHWRCDGIFGGQSKPLLQLNPFVRKKIDFDCADRLHCFPILSGRRMHAPDWIVHYGMRTRALREKNVAKYEAADPEQRFSTVPYRYLLDEDGIQLRRLDAS